MFGQDDVGLRRILEERAPIGELTVDGGQVWRVFASSSATDSEAPQDYALATFALGDAFILTGSGTVEEFAELAGALSTAIAAVVP